MHGVLPVATAVARVVTPGCGSDSEFSPASGGEYRDWFFDAACAICGTKDPGYQLHLFTGWPLTSCRYYMARDSVQRRKPSPEFLRILFRSRHGEPFFRAFMHGCDAGWFVDLMRAEDRAREAEAKLATIRDLAK